MIEDTIFIRSCEQINMQKVNSKTNYLQQR